MFCYSIDLWLSESHKYQYTVRKQRCIVVFVHIWGRKILARIDHQIQNLSKYKIKRSFLCSLSLKLPIHFFLIFFHKWKYNSKLITFWANLTYFILCSETDWRSHMASFGPRRLLKVRQGIWPYEPWIPAVPRCVGHCKRVKTTEI